MNNFGRWFHLPRKRSNSTPTRQILTEALNRLANEPPSQSKNEQHPYHNITSDGYSSLSTNNTKTTSSFNAAQSTPLLITSAYRDFSYSIDPNQSPDDETPPEVANSRPSTPSSATTDLKTQQNPHDLSNQNKQLSSDTHYNMHFQRDYEQGATLDYYPPQDITWHTKTSPRKIPSNKSGSLNIKRRPTPYVDQRSSYHSGGQEENEIAYNHYGGIEYTSAMDDHQIRYASASNSQKMIDKGTYNEEVRKLKAEIKRLEKKHKEHERHMLDTQQQLEYFISRSCESTFFGNGVPYYSYSSTSSNNEHYSSSTADGHHYHSQSLNERRPQRGNYYYPPYDMDYYYTNQTPSNSYSNHASSFHPSSCKSKEPYDYFTLPKKSNDSINHGSINATASSSGTSRRYDMNDNSNRYSYEYDPSSYVSNGMMDDENYYHLLQQRRRQLLYYNQYLEQGFSPPRTRENNKRWSTCL
ncbi:hypothetical protein [Parasitella parasitica]|uniref:Uncharacterized protein n=1 Tax=Parasitella parasitica TaxID=35722 RepID=A0A0B7NN66_9FUNG|nr:hypothetical protein [Parasitella parasitica]